MNPAALQLYTGWYPGTVPFVKTVWGTVSDQETIYCRYAVVATNSSFIAVIKNFIVAYETANDQLSAYIQQVYLKGGAGDEIRTIDTDD